MIFTLNADTNFVPCSFIESRLTYIVSRIARWNTKHHKRLQVAGLTVNVMGDSGKIHLTNRGSNVLIDVGDIHEVGKNGISIARNISDDKNWNYSGFIIDSEGKKDVELMKKVHRNAAFLAARGDEISLTKKLPNGCKFNIGLYLVSQMGMATIGNTNQEAWPVFPGDLKFNFELSELHSCVKDDFEYLDVYFRIEITDNSSGKSSLGNMVDTKVHLPENFKLHDPNGKTSPDPTGVQSFTYRFNSDGKTNILSDSFLVWHSLLSTPSLALIREDSVIKSRRKSTYHAGNPSFNFDLSTITNNAMMSSQLLPPVSIQENQMCRKSTTLALFRSLSWLVVGNRRELLNILGMEQIKIMFKDRPFIASKKFAEEQGINSVEDLCQALTIKKFDRTLKQDFLHPWRNNATPYMLKRKMRKICNCKEKLKKDCFLSAK